MDLVEDKEGKKEKEEEEEGAFNNYERAILAYFRLNLSRISPYWKQQQQEEHSKLSLRLPVSGLRGSETGDIFHPCWFVVEGGGGEENVRNAKKMAREREQQGERQQFRPETFLIKFARLTPR